MGAFLSLFLARPPKVEETLSKPTIVWAHENDDYDYKIDAEIYMTNVLEIELDIEGIDKLELLYGLWCNASYAPVILASNIMLPSFDVEAARKKLASESAYFDYLNGSAIKTRIKGNTIDPYRYDHYHGLGKCARVIDFIRSKMEGATTHRNFEFYKSQLRKRPKIEDVVKLL